MEKAVYIKEYCSCQSVNFRNVLIVPNGVSELSLT